MRFACRICKEKFILSKYATDTKTVDSEGYSVVSVSCGHVFHTKCLEAALTNQRLLHAQHGTGPLRRICPVAACNTDIPSENSITKLLLDEDQDSTNSENTDQDVEGKLVKRIQILQTERDRLAEAAERADNEIDTLNSVLDEIKFDLSDIQSFMKDDPVMRKGDLIFWVTKDDTFVPGKILELRKKPGEKTHYAIIKLDKKTKVSGVGPYSANRETLIVPVTELIMFKTFFAEFLDKFQAKFAALLGDLNAEIQGLSSPTGSQASDRGSTYYRSNRKFSRNSSSYKSYGSISQLNVVNELDSSVSVDSIPVFRKTSQPIPPKTIFPEGKMANITRSKTIHYGVSEEPRRLEKIRSLSWANGPTSIMNTSSMESPTISEISRTTSMFTVGSLQSPDSVIEGDGDDGPNEFTKEGERVIWYDTYSDSEYQQQLGTVAAVCEFSPCAIVHFDEHPFVKHKFQYMTVPMDELFPYELASMDDKERLHEIYGTLDEQQNEIVDLDMSSPSEPLFDTLNNVLLSEFEDAQQTVVSGIPDGEEDA